MKIIFKIVIFVNAKTLDRNLIPFSLISLWATLKSLICVCGKILDNNSIIEFSFYIEPIVSNENDEINIDDLVKDASMKYGQATPPINDKAADADEPDSEPNSPGDAQLAPL